ncbi:deoxyribodipyrimidine photolyase [Williamsia sp. Leaf354]|uniref:FAD-binding domain-containing protein n=1 Tax=Williamsia sp. Leaf354 TaxID=1736349 RepID=UPI000700BC01|nr:FAD-binding domain-containing protein [Williamsia sp. Leaf354]KQS00680.1 deoxyribodipyrimidine photolyase [Williamsia sp. Leaf354]
MALIPTPPAPSGTDDHSATIAWVAEHLGDLAREDPADIAAGAFTGGQTAADVALASLDITGYARDRNTVLPVNRRGASRMSPYIRHGLLSLREVWDAVSDTPGRDKSKYRDELLWQEYARHLYARVGTDLGESLRYEQPRRPVAPEDRPFGGDPWPTAMNCMSATLDELHDDGWLVNQTRMWMASQWTVRVGASWREGEDEMFAHLLDGSRAANRLGWQWTVGTGSGKPYGFSRWQVQKRSPSLCGECALNADCPIEDWPPSDHGAPLDGPYLGASDIPTGPTEVDGAGADQVWLTAESLGHNDPALAADADRPAVFVFDEPLLRRLRLSGKRLVFLAECLGDIAAGREVEVRRGVVADELDGRSLAATWAPVPGFGRISAQVTPVELHPWPWLVTPRRAPVRSFSAWRKAVGTPR